MLLLAARRQIFALFFTFSSNLILIWIKSKLVITFVADLTR